MPVFEIKAKQDLGGGKVKKGQTIEVVTGYQTCCDTAIADTLKKKFGSDASKIGSNVCYWEIKKK